ncbi:MAG TPA: hypothetical protein DEQ61_06770 [Streptomyces sp.]|nr:hypothetical protein [Streptomyces sp.]
MAEADSRAVLPYVSAGQRRAGGNRSAEHRGVVSVTSNHKPASSCAVGELALDARQGRVGVVMDAQGGRMYLRRPEGGREWEASPQDLRPANPGEARAGLSRGAHTQQ